MELNTDLSADPLPYLLNSVVESAAPEVKQEFIAFPDHPLKTWIRLHPGATKLEVAESSEDLSRFQVYNWLAGAMQRGEVICVEGKYYSPLHQQYS